MGWWLSRCSAWNYCLIEIIKLIRPRKISCICAGTQDKEDAGGGGRTLEKLPQYEECFQNE